MAAKYESFTIDMVKAAGEAEAQAMVDTMSTVYRSEARADEKKGIAAAYALRAALQNGIKQAAVAKAWGKIDPRTKQVTPKPNATMTLFKRMGIVADVLGYLPGSEEWYLLSSQAGANITQVGTLIDTLEGPKKIMGVEYPQSTEAELRDMLYNVAFTPDLRKRTKKEIDEIIAKRESGDSTESGGESGGSTGDDETPANVPVVGTFESRIDTAYADLRAVLAQVEFGSAVWKKFYAEQAAWVETFDAASEKASESAANTRKRNKRTA